MEDTLVNQTPTTTHESRTTVADVTERALIARIQERLPPAPGWMIVGIGDDAAVVEPEKNRAEVWTVDALVEGVHFDRSFVPPDAIGYRALAANLSDLAAMGASPRAALLSLALPDTLPLADFDAIVGGFARLAAQHGVHLAGGNITRSPGPLTIDVTAIGTVKRRQALRRVGARPGDDLYVSGTVGSAGIGLQILKSSPSLSSVSPVVERFLYPEPRVRLGVLLGRNRTASASVDLSDGLADGIQRIAEASGVGVVVDADALPIDVNGRAWCLEHGIDPVHMALSAGDDYELLFSVRPRARGRLKGPLEHGGTTLTRIGTCTKETALVVRSIQDGRQTERPLPPTDYQHFR